MKHVVVRCPGCGRDGGAVFDACEACGNQLRGWCLVHGGETGWLDRLVCARCIAADMRAAPPSTRVHAARAMPEPAAVTGVAPRADVTARAAAPVDDGGVTYRVFAMLLTLLFMAVGGGLLGIYAGFLYLMRGGGGSPLQWGKVGLFVGVVCGLVAATRSAPALPTHAPPSSLPGPDRIPPSVDPPPPSSFPDPDPTPPSAGYPPPSSWPSEARTPSSAGPAPPPFDPGPPRTRPAAATDSPPFAPSKWPGGRSPREVLRGPRKSLAELGLPDLPPPPTAGDILSLGVGGAVFGMVAGWVAAVALGVSGVSFLFATVLGLGGLVVGIIRFAAFQHAARSGDDG
jgi:hypothetical protein